MTMPALPIYIDAYRLTQSILCQTVKFPKDFKFMVGQSLNETALHLCMLITQAGHSQAKATLLDEVLMTLEKIKILLRLCADFNLTSCQQQANLAVLLGKITGQALAWSKSERRRQTVS